MARSGLASAGPRRRARGAPRAALFALAPFGALGGPAWIEPSEAPVSFALVFLGSNVGLAFVALSATAPLLSSWYAQAGGGRPYFLYAASNAGSLGALLAYPLLVEPLLDVPAQARLFRWGVGIVAVGIVAAGIGVIRARPGASADAPTEPEPAPTWRRRLTWVGLAFVPSALLAGSTTYLSTDLAPLPLLWVLPLAVYLISFVLAFSGRVGPPAPIVGRAACLVGLVLVFATVTHANEPVALLSALHMLFLFAGSWIAHRRLADDAPHPGHLPQFFVWMAVGGVLGTLVSGVLAPELLPDLYEYPAAIALACATRRKAGVVVEDRPWKKDVLPVLVVPALVLVASWIVPRLSIGAPPLVALLTFGPAALYAYRWMPLRRRYTLCLLALVLSLGATQDRGRRRLTTRSFFGVLRVVDSGQERYLLSGTTLHGTQRLDQRDRCVPLAYYRQDGPLGSVFEARRALGRRGRTVAIGLGTGAVTCYAAPGEPWRVIEINPDVIEIASDPEWFTYLARCPSDRLEVTLGDGRVGMREEADGAVSLIVVDAFNSDSVPAHLLTREALRLYLDKLEPGGWVVFHLSNRVLRLSRVVANVAAAEGAAARIMEDQRGTYAVVARRAEDLEPLARRGWRPLDSGDPAAAWTDAFSSLLSAIDF